MLLDILQFLNRGAIASLSAQTLLIGWGEPRLLAADELDLDKPAFYASNFFLETDRPWSQYAQSMLISRAELEQTLGRVASAVTCDWSFERPERFKQTFEELQGDFQQGLLQKAVPYLFVRSPQTMSAARLGICLKKGLAALDAGHLYGQWQEGQGVLGLTPEWLFSHSATQPACVRTMALAGTTHPSQSQEAFLHNEKERHEHGLVVEGICQALRDLGSIGVGTRQLVALPRLSHLMTPIELTLNRPFCFDELVQALHPTPAVGAWPYTYGWNWLKRHQLHTPRGIYGAPFGFADPHSGLSRCLVAIRNVQWNLEGMRMGVGCGIVQQSQFEQEWREIQFKIRAIRGQLHL